MSDAMRTPSGAPSSKAREKHGGSHGEFPIFDHESAHSALMLRGHAPDPAKIIARVRAWANEHNDKAILAECDAATEKDKKVESRSEEQLNILSPGVETRAAANVDNVNFAERIITVLAVPYEQPTVVPFQNEAWNEVFSRTAFNGLDATKRRVPATACLEVPDRGHSAGRIVGRAVSFDLLNELGLRTELKISRTPQGDETLELANDNNLDVSVGFLVKNRLDQQLDRATRTRRINRAFLDHIAFVADQPAYPGAKVLAVRTEGSEESSMSPTPLLDEFIDDPIFQWAQNRTK